MTLPAAYRVGPDIFTDPAPFEPETKPIFDLRTTGSTSPIPCEVKRIAIDGNLAFVHVRYLDWGGQETAGVDIFRFDDDGKTVEHWDVLQPVPAASNNSNTMF
jgi:predicted SnoaL-like aldol condensation-catalyzing enzyme